MGKSKNKIFKSIKGFTPSLDRAVQRLAVFPIQILAFLRGRFFEKIWSNQGRCEKRTARLSAGFTPSLDRALQHQAVFFYIKRVLAKIKNVLERNGFMKDAVENRSARLSAGFTLIEILVVISIMALLSAILIVYNRSGESQIILLKDQAKIISLLLKSKNLAFQTYTAEGGNTVCGYGVHFDAANGDFLIFKDSADPCSSSDNKYSGTDENFEKQKLDSRLEFSNLELNDILFVPPEPIVIIDGDAGKKGDFEIAIESNDGGGAKKIKVNNFGQVTAQ